MLIAEDDPDLGDLLVRLLSSTDWDVTCVQDGLRAIEEWDRAADTGRPFDAVVVDHGLPLLTGLEVATRILRRSRGQLVALYSGQLTPALTARAADVGVRASVDRTQVDELPRLLGYWLASAGAEG